MEEKQKGAQTCVEAAPAAPEVKPVMDSAPQAKGASRASVIAITAIIALVVGVGAGWLVASLISGSETPEVSESQEQAPEVTDTEEKKTEFKPVNLVTGLDDVMSLADGGVSLENNCWIGAITECDVTVRNKLRVSLDATYYGSEVAPISDVPLTLEKNVRAIIAGGMGQAVGYEVVILVMEDGTVKYIPQYASLKAGEVIIREVPTAEGIVAVACGGIGGRDFYLQQADGAYYRLYDLIGGELERDNGISR